MDPSTVLGWSGGLFGVGVLGLGAVLVSYFRSVDRRAAQDADRRAAITNARWEARTTIKHGKACVQLVRVARGIGVVETDDHVVEIPVGDSMGLLNAQADAEVAAAAANGDVL